MRFFVLLIALFVAIAISYSTARAANQRRVMPWMCLERCNDTAADIAEQLSTIKENVDLFAAVSFELYNLGPNSTLIRNDGLTPVAEFIENLGLETYPMISSYPYPPQFIDWCREVFANPEPFIQTCLEEATKYNYAGFNVDWEPATGVEPGDAEAYAAFLVKFADALHSIGKKLTVDIATWSPFWSYSLLNATNVDRLITMATYVGDNAIWQEVFEKAVSQISLDKLGIGLETVDAHNNPLTDEDIQLRFSMIQAKDVTEVDIWRMPLGNNFFPYLQKWVNNGN